MKDKTIILAFILIIVGGVVLFFEISHPPPMPDYRLQFRLISKNNAEAEKTISVGGESTEYDLVYLYDWKNKEKYKDKAYLVEKEIFLDARFIIDAFERKDPTSGKSSLFIKLDQNGSQRLKKIKNTYLNRRMAIIVNGELIATLVIPEIIENGSIDLMNVGSPQIINEIAALLKEIPAPPGYFLSYP